MADPDYPGLAMPVTRLAARILSGVGFLGLAYGVGIILLVTPQGESDSGPTVAVISGVLGLAGIVWVVVARNRLLARPAHPRGFLTAIVVSAGVCELGLLIGITGFVVTGDLLGPAIGGVCFVVGILILGSTIGSVEFGTDRIG